MRQVFLSRLRPRGTKREINLRLAVATNHLRDNGDLFWTEPREKRHRHADCGEDSRRRRAEDDKPSGAGMGDVMKPSGSCWRLVVINSDVII